MLWVCSPGKVFNPVSLQTALLAKLAMPIEGAPSGLLLRILVYWCVLIDLSFVPVFGGTLLHAFRHVSIMSYPGPNLVIASSGCITVSFLAFVAEIKAAALRNHVNHALA